MGKQKTRRVGPSRTFEGKTLAVREQPPSETQYRAPVEGAAAFSERYVDVAALGSGGMGEVRLCLDTRMAREVAVKRIHADRRGQAQRERFLREARIQAQLDHPVIVPVYDIGVDDDGLEYFTMKRAVGVTLEEILERVADGEPAFCEKYPLAVRLGIFRQVLQAVEYAHSRGIVHRDLKPANVIVGELGETYVLDWGIAKLTEGDAPEGLRTRSFKTGAGAILGTPGYLSPEQTYSAEQVDGRTDAYSLGAILFELLTLEPLHEGSEVQALLDAVRLGRSEARISVRRPDIDIAPELERACVMATRTSPDERLRVSELLALVAGYLEGDRDVALRRELAQRHAETAVSAHAALRRSDEEEGELRSEALHQAGRALALDPQSETAIEVITQLMAEPPRAMPPEVARMLRDEQERSELAAQRGSMWAYVAFMPLLVAGAFLTHINDWYAMAAMGVPLMLAIILTGLKTLDRRLSTPPLLTLGCVLVAISATSCLGSPYVIMPALLAAFGTAAIGASSGATRRPLLWAGMCVAAAVVPMVLQALEWLPVGLSITGNRVLIEHRVSDASPTYYFAVLVMTTLVTILAPMGFSYRSVRQLRDTRERLLLHVWHLRQLTTAV